MRFKAVRLSLYIVLANASYATAEQPIASRTLPDLVIEAGETRTVLARLHQFKSVHIKRGGILQIAPNSSRWTMIWAEGDVIVDGNIIGQGCARTIHPLTDRTPDNKVITHQYANQAEGGQGGLGGYALVPGRGTAAGGRGAVGTVDYGGGGGSPGGVHFLGPSTRLGSNGIDATAWRGGPPTPDGGYGKAGGDGGRVGAYPNGCPLLLYAGTTFKGNGQIRLAGLPGASGKPGAEGGDSNRGDQGAGGGGGAPGGEGGRLVVVAINFENDPNVMLDGGRGGLVAPPANIHSVQPQALREMMAAPVLSML